MQKYSEIVNYILDKVSTNEFKFKQRLPTIRELSENFNCTKITAVRAYTELQKRHIVYSIPQSGYYLVNINKDTCLNPNIVDFASESPDESILPYEDFQHCLNQVIAKYKQVLFNYSNPQGVPSLISALAENLQDQQIFTNPANLFVTAGSQQAINILCQMNFPNNKNTVLVEEPTYTGILNSLKFNHIPVIGLRRCFDGIDLHELERHFATNTIKFFFTTPRFHNPLGTSLTNDQKKHIAELAAKYDVYIVEDDYLADLELNKSLYPIYYNDLASKVIYIKSFSKILMPGLRIAIVVLPSILKDTFEKHKWCTDFGTSILSQGILELYINSGIFKLHQKKSKKIYAKKIALVKSSIKTIDASCIQWHIPNMGFFTCIKTFHNIDVDNFIKKVAQKNVLIKNIKYNYLDNKPENNILKLSLSKTSINKIDYGISVILHELEKIIR